MKLKLHEPGNPLAVEVLTAKEVELGFRLPEGYRDFLLNVTNGTRVINNDPDTFGVGLSAIRGINHKEEYWLDLEGLLALMADRIYPGFFPFGTTEFGDVVCISTRKQDTGTIWAWNHDTEPETEDEPPLLESLIYVAASFEAFANDDYPEVNFEDQRR